MIQSMHYLSFCCMLNTDIRSPCCSTIAAVEWLSSNSLPNLHLWLPPGYTISSNFHCRHPTWRIKHPPGFSLRQKKQSYVRWHQYCTTTKYKWCIIIIMIVIIVMLLFLTFSLGVKTFYYFTSKSWCFPYQFLSGWHKLSCWGAESVLVFPSDKLGLWSFCRRSDECWNVSLNPTV